MPNNVVLRLYLDKGLLNEGDDLLLVEVGGCRICKEESEFNQNAGRGDFVFEYNMDV